MEHILKIYGLQRVESDGVVNSIMYGVESNHNNHTERYTSTLAITGSSTDGGFISYENLTEDVVLGWVTSSIDIPAIEVQNSASIAQIEFSSSNQTIKKIGIPWEE